MTRVQQDRYRELLRCVRQWMWIKARKWSGSAHDDPQGTNIRPGGLVPFCPTCPQPEVNLPPEWESDTELYVLPFNYLGAVDLTSV